MARALCFREPQWDLVSAEDIAVRFGFDVELAQEPVPEPEPEPAAQ
jgi:hypothetical protein